MEEIEKINDLILNRSYEGTYWDYKFEHHKNKADLLHDILCLANCKHDGDRFIIIGVYDPSKCPDKKGTERIVGTQDNKNRRNTVQLIDWLDKIGFEGGNRPEVFIKEYTFDENTVDVIVIKNNYLKPYYLKSDYKINNTTVYKHHIYTRKQDKNTAIDKSADIYDVEEMWKERFGIDLPILHRLKLLLKKQEEWKICSDSVQWKDDIFAYHSIFPEFKITLGRKIKHDGVEPISTFFHNFYNITCQRKIYFKYHDTVICDWWIYIFMSNNDDYVISFPEEKIVKSNTNESFEFYYYCLDEINGIFAKFQNNNFKNMTAPLINQIIPILIFNNTQELNDFTSDVKNNFDKIRKINSNYKINDSEYNKYVYAIKRNLKFYYQCYDYYEQRK